MLIYNQSLIPCLAVVDDFKPSVYVTLSYASKHKTVDLGNKIKPKKVTSQPVFSINASPMTPTRTFESNMTYTLVLSDPDATSRAEPVKAQMCHWIVANLTLPFQPADPDGALGWAQSFGPARETQENSVEEIMPYLPPTPPPKTGYHRYVFVLLAPGTGEDTQGELTKPKERPHWGYGKVGAGVREWADENGLVVVGKQTVTINSSKISCSCCLGANFFYSQNKNQ